MDEALTAIGERSPWKVGIEPARHVFLIENHDQAYYIWRDAGVKNRVLVHVDAHHDMWWIDDQATITIADFICPALKQDLVREVIWVVPDATFASVKNRKAVLHHLKKILNKYPGASRTPLVEPDRIQATVLEKKLTICALTSLPALNESVLLDIDVDYMVIPRVSSGEFDQHSSLPWRWPEELLGKLRGIASDLVTVVYSVEGGYTPLEWKYLGDEIISRLKNPDGGAELEGMDRMREGAETEARGKAAGAESKYRQAMELLPGSAGPGYRLTRLLMREGREEEARRVYGQAIARDASYTGAYSSQGFHRYLRREYTIAEREFRDKLTLDSEDAYSRYGLGLLAKRRRRWSEAEQHLRGALAGDNSMVGAQRALGDVLVKQGKWQEGLEAYERALKLGLMGQKPLSGPILSQAPGHRPLLDPLHGDTHARLAVLYARSGDRKKAITALRIGIASGFGSAAVRFRLARLYARNNEWRKSAAELWQAMKVAPKDARAGYLRLYRRLRGRMREAAGGGA